MLYLSYKARKKQLIKKQIQYHTSLSDVVLSMATLKKKLRGCVTV